MPHPIEEHFSLTPRAIHNISGDLTPKPCVFHYTDFHGALGIMNSGKLWATNIHYLNDYTEFKHGLEIAAGIVGEEIRTGSEPKLVPVYESIIPLIGQIERTNIFICSFSEHDDSLSQWRAYGKEAGVSLGFRFDELQQIAGRHQLAAIKCIYDQAKKEELIRRALHDATHIASADPAGRFISLLELLAAAFKHLSFAEEAEWRLISMPTPIDHANVNFRTTATMMIPHYEIDLDILKAKDAKGKRVLGIAAIRIGPNERAELASSAVLGLLHRRNIRWFLGQTSSAPYRTRV